MSITKFWKGICEADQQTRVNRHMEVAEQERLCYMDVATERVFLLGYLFFLHEKEKVTYQTPEEIRIVEGEG